MASRRASAACFFGTVTLAAAASAQGEVDARSTAAKGVVAWFAQELKLDASSEMRGGNQTQSQVTHRTLRVEIRDVDAAGRFEVAVTLVRVQGKHTTNGRVVAFDSNDGEPKVGMQATLAAGAGQTFTAKVDARGELVELGAGAEELAKATRSMSHAHPLDHAGMKQVVRDVFGSLPMRRTAGGAKWSRKHSHFFGPLPFQETLELTLTEVEPEMFEIEGVGALEVMREGFAADETPDPLVSGQFADMELLSSKVTRTQQTSRADGLVRTSRFEAALEMQTVVPPIGKVVQRATWITSLRRIDAPADATKAKQPGAAPDPAKAPAPATGK